MNKHPNNEFIGACIHFDQLMERLSQLRGDHFNCDPETQRNWGDVGSVKYATDRLQEILAHFSVPAA